MPENTSTVPDPGQATLALLRCPVCRGAMVRVVAGPVRCADGHAFDVARQGHLNLLGGSGTRGLVADTADMVAARSSVQQAEVFAPVAAALTQAVCDAEGLPAGGLVDLGGGTGYYTSRVLDAVPDLVGVSLDLSSPAARRAARAHPRLLSVVADVWRELPLADAGAAVVLCVFAPRNPAEIARVLAPGGLLLVVTPRPAHLHELLTRAGMLAIDADKERRLAEQLASFDDVGEQALSYLRPLSPPLAADLVLMGPSAFHVDPADLRRRLTDETSSATIDVRVGAYRRPGAPR